MIAGMAMAYGMGLFLLMIFAPLIGMMAEDFVDDDLDFSLAEIVALIFFYPLVIPALAIKGLLGLVRRLW